jgi:hypothetical protein
MTTIAFLKKEELLFVQMDDLIETFNRIVDDDTNYIYTEELKALTNINTENDMFILKVLIENSAITLCDIDKTTPGNPIYQAYRLWETTWRSKSIRYMYSWRKTIDSFTAIMDLVGTTDLRLYIRGLEDIHCVLYDEKNTSVESVTKLLHDNLKAKKASSYINSVGRPEIQTHVEGTTVVMNRPFKRSPVNIK